MNFVATRARAVLVSLCVFAASSVLAQPVADGVVNSGEYTWSNGDWRMAWDETYLYVAKVLIPTGGIAIHLDVDPRSTPTAGSGENGNLESQELIYGAGVPGYRPRYPFRGDAAVMGGPTEEEFHVRDGSGGWTSGDAEDVVVGTGNATVEMQIRWDGIPGLTGRPASFNWAAHQILGAGISSTASNPMPPANTSGGARIEYFFHVASTDSPTDPFSERRSTWVVTSNADSGTWSLRSAIDSVNNDTDSTRRYITFDLSDDYTIGITASLPMLIRPVTVDGTAHPGYNDQGPIVLIDGPGPAQNVDGLQLFNVSNSDIRGLSFSDLTRAVIVQGGSFNTIAANWIGYIAECTTGIQAQSTNDLTIGGATVDDRNIIANSSTGIAIDATMNAQIVNNRIGNDGNDNGMGNFNGIAVSSATDMTIALNIIGGNTNDGINIADTSDVTITGNLIGVKADGTTYLGNGGDGIDGQSMLTIGTLASPNVIANSSGAGIKAAGGDLLIRGNSIYANAITLTNEQPAPAIHSAHSGNGTDLAIDFSISSNNTVAQTRSIQLDLYRNDDGPRQYVASSPCYEATVFGSLPSTRWIVSNVSNTDSYVVMASSYEDYTCTNPGDGTSEPTAPFTPDSGATTTLDLTSPATTAWSGAPMTFTATLTASQTPTGTVTFRVNGADVAHCTGAALTGNEAQCAIPFSANGTNSVDAVYSGDAFNAADTSNEIDVTVKTHTFTGSGDFFDASRWTDNVLPGAGENIRIEGSATFTTNGVALQYGAMELINDAAIVWNTNHQTPLRIASLTNAGHVNMLAGGILQLLGSWAPGGNFLPGAGTVILAGSNTVPARTFNHLAVTGFVGSSDGAATVNGTLTVAGGATLTPTDSITVNGAISNAGTLQFATLVIGAGSTVTANGSFSASTMNVLGTFVPTASTVFNGTVTGSGTVYVTSVATPSSFASQYVGPKSLANLSVHFNGASAQSVDPLEYGSLTFDNASGGTILSGNVSISGTLYLEAGALTADPGGIYILNTALSAVTRLNGWVGGRFFNWQIAPGTNSYTFPVGLPTSAAPITVTFHDAGVNQYVGMSAWVPAELGATMNGTGLDTARDANVVWRMASSVASYDVSIGYAGLPDAAAIPTAFALRVQHTFNHIQRWLDWPATAGPSSMTATGITRGDAMVQYITAGNQLADASKSQVSTPVYQIVASNASTTTVTVQLRDQLNVPLKIGGDAVVLSTTLGTLGSVADNNNGTYTATLTAGTTRGRSVTTGTVNGGTLSDNAVVLFGSGVRGDFNADKKTDLFWQHATTSQLYLWYMNGSSLISGANVNSAGSGWRVAGAHDWDNDGDSDLLWQNANTFQAYIWYMNGNAFVSGANMNNSGTNWNIVGPADFDQDGDPDVLWQHATTGQLYLWYLNNNLRSSDANVNSLGSDWTAAGTGDFNYDGRPDIVWRNQSTGANKVWFMNQNLMTSEASFPSVGSGWRIVAIGDYNNDGKDDLFFQFTATGQNYVWYMDGTSKIGETNVNNAGSASWQVVAPN